MKWHERVDWRFFVMTAAILAAPYVVYRSPADPRMVGWTLAAVAAGGLLWRLIGWFDVTPTGMRIMAFLLIVTLVLGAIGQYLFTHDPNIPVTPITYLLISQRLMCIGAAIYWVKWTDTKVSPFLRSKA